MAPEVVKQLLDEHKTLSNKLFDRSMPCQFVGYCRFSDSILGFSSVKFLLDNERTPDSPSQTASRPGLQLDLSTGRTWEVEAISSDCIMVVTTWEAWTDQWTCNKK